jgi:geranylgeranyl reductase family protein
MNGASFFDVAVVGAGPAGCPAALALSRAGLRVAIFEKAELPRYKTCGGGLLARAVKLLPGDLHSVIERQCYYAELHHHGPRLTYSTNRDAPIVTMVMRDRFDHGLTVAAEQSGVRIIARTTVLKVAVAEEKVTLSTTAGEFTAGFVIGADGATSAVAGHCGFPGLPRVIPALECEVTVKAEQFERFSFAARFDFGMTPHGYGWVFPKKNHLSVGVLTTRRGSCNLNQEYQRYLVAIGLGDITEEQRHGYIIPIRPREGLFAQPRVLLVGDAAGLADPVTAEGISAAIMSGQLAAASIIRHPQNAKAAIAAYRTGLRATLLSELRIARVLSKGLYDFPRLRSWLFARHGQSLSEFVTDVVMGAARYRDAVGRPKNYLRLLGRPLQRPSDL